MAKKKKIKKPAKTIAKKTVGRAGKKPSSKKSKSTPKRKPVKRYKSTPKAAIKRTKGKAVKALPKGKKIAKPTIAERRKRGVNRYNSIRAAISSSYAEQGKKISNAEIKEIYAWIKDKHSESPTSQIVSNIDVLISQYYGEVGVETIDRSLFNPAVEWFGFKEVLHDELSLHKPDDLVRVDLTDIGVVDWVDFLMEDYLTGAETVYERCKEAGIRRASPVPMIELIDAFRDDGENRDVYMYKITAEEEFMDAVGTGVAPPVDIVEGEGEKAVIPITKEPAVTKPTKPTTGVPPTTAAPLSPEQIASNERIRLKELENERDREIRQEKLVEREKVRKDFLQLFRDKLITLKEYTDAIKELGIG